MKVNILIVLLVCISFIAVSQNVTISGKVIDAKSGLPLVSATIRIKDKSFGTTSGSTGDFTLALPAKTNDTLVISYLGYKSLPKHLNTIDTSHSDYALEELPVMLDEIVVLSKKQSRFEVRRLESSLKVIEANLYTAKIEVTNFEYNLFLSHLLNTNQTALYNKYKPNVSKYSGSDLLFFKAYHSQQLESNRSELVQNYDEYPVVNISYEAVIAYCEWLTESYNNTKAKKKFKKVMFKLPTVNEWQIAALGYPKFQSWVVEENEVEVTVPDNPVDEIGKTKKVIPVKGNEILYPWFGSYNYRNKPQNRRSCWMGNFKVPEESMSCVKFRAGGDGYVFTGNVATYFPNGMGLYDMVGNVSEMLYEKGKACGGSWNHSPEESTIMSVNTYVDASGAVGFRIFMEALDD